MGRYSSLMALGLALLLAATSAAALPPSTSAAAQQYLAGVGIADVTGPAAEVNMMGYAVMEQSAKGIHTRQWARAFIFGDSGGARKRVLFVVVDSAMVSQHLTSTVVGQLQAEYGSLYTEDNVVLTATHTHASAGGFLEHFLYHITSLGFVKQTFDALADGILEAVRAAHSDIRPATLSWSEGELLEANINRSPTAYQANPPEERQRYKHDVDKDMTVLRVQAVEPSGSGTTARGRGLISWFPVHPVSMSNTNRLLSSDNKGFAQQLLEKEWAPQQQQQLESGFVAAFAQSNGADTSPNTKGTFCIDTGLPCDQVTSTCNGDNQLCVGRGPGWPDEFKSTEIIGRRQAEKAQELWSGPSNAISGPIDFRHIWVEIANTDVVASNFTRAGQTCDGAMGWGFAAGTTDGPGAHGFYQSDRHTGVARSLYSPLALLINSAARMVPSPHQKECQGDKPILLNVGEALTPYPWVPRTTSVTLLRIGNFVIVCMPGEFTTMSGRRVREAVRAVVAPVWGPDVNVVLTSLANTYSSYVATYEEYQQQRYEGSSTLYGPHTLDAYIQAAVTLADAMAHGKQLVSTAAAAAPQDFTAKLLSLLPGVVVDSPPPGRSFGEAIKQPSGAYAPGQTVEASFWGANPRNNLRRGDTFLEVQRRDDASDGGNQWVTVHTDDDWSTKFEWARPASNALQSMLMSASSVVTVSWTVPERAAPGVYRIKYHGDAKNLMGKISAFEGVSQVFEVAGS